MTTHVVEPDHISPASLDHYLERGWFRVGRHLMTRRYQVIERRVRGVVWTRLPLGDYAFRKGLRRLLDRTRRDFRVSVGPMALDEAAHDVFRRHRQSRSWGRDGAELIDFLGGEAVLDHFPTREIRIHDGDRLAAYGLYDQGAVGIQSLVGAFDPAYERASLGFATLLIEIDEGMKAGLAYHYTGDVVFEPNMMQHYKWRVGHLEILHPDTLSWCSQDLLTTVEDPAQQIERAIASARAALSASGLSAQVELNPYYEMPHYNPQLLGAVDQPLALVCAPSDDRTSWVVTWDGETREYTLRRCVRAVTEARREGSEETTRIPLLWTRENKGRYPTLAQLVAALS